MIMNVNRYIQSRRLRQQLETTLTRNPFHKSATPMSFNKKNSFGSHWPSSIFNGESFFHQSHPDPFMTPGKVGTLGVSKNNDTPQIIHFNKVFHHKPSILGYLYFRKHPCWDCEKKRRKRRCFVVVYCRGTEDFICQLPWSFTCPEQTKSGWTLKSWCLEKWWKVLWWQKGIDIADIQVFVEHYHSYNLRGGISPVAMKNPPSVHGERRKYNAPERYFTWRIATGRMQGFVPPCNSCWK